MGETPADSDLSPEAAAVERARQYAEQRRVVNRLHFDTPTWLGPERHPDRQHDGVPPTIPSQTEPSHDELVPVPVGIPRTGHWVQSARPRLIAGSFLALSVAGAAACLVWTIATQSVTAIVGLVLCAFVAVVCRGAMMSAGLSTVDLLGSILTVRHHGYVDTFDLAGPVQLVELAGTPGQRDWRLRLETVEGRVVELGPRQVDPVEMDRIVQYYRAIANRERRARDLRNRS